MSDHLARFYVEHFVSTLDVDLRRIFRDSNRMFRYFSSDTSTDNYQISLALLRVFYDYVKTRPHLR